ncbi:hypothetical protein [Xanthobacter tagetidis]|uniref:Uncharacterized protein n=1 Tax=Xanthobacter tagetidis TaxID=60216 RepID=A0A3L7AHU2_9HYPH|nr:hypothetical protein [Xanthobacter tagetidis]MBB6306247.1 ribosome modulation factor [Xanthobacter tagetidis]RLP79525.1 hypothetical protein D9R14_07630 [Xanthobacter tagetidis]
MGRPKGSKNKPKIVPSEAAPSAGHNQLSDEQVQALFFQHKKKYEAALAVKKKADADFKNACKLAKSEIGDDAVERIKYALELETEEGEAKLKARMERQAEVARWMGLPIGAQASLFGEDRTPGDERAFGEGKRAGMEGKERRPPYDAATSQFRKWLEGYDAGQEVNRSLMADAIKPLSEKAPPADPFDDAFPDEASNEDEWDRAAPEPVH